MSIVLLDHQEVNHLLAVVEQPKGQNVYKDPEWQERFCGYSSGSLSSSSTWRYFRADGCALGLSSPDLANIGMPILKGYEFMANFDLSLIEHVCKSKLSSVGGP